MNPTKLSNCSPAVQLVNSSLTRLFSLLNWRYLASPGFSVTFYNSLHKSSTDCAADLDFSYFSSCYKASFMCACLVLGAYCYFLRGSMTMVVMGAWFAGSIAVSSASYLLPEVFVSTSRKLLTVWGSASASFFSGPNQWQTEQSTVSCSSCCLLSSAGWNDRSLQSRDCWDRQPWGKQLSLSSLHHR